MSKRGSKYLRTAVIEAAEVAALVANDPLFKGIYEAIVQTSRGHNLISGAVYFHLQHCFGGHQTWNHVHTLLRV